MAGVAAVAVIGASALGGATTALAVGALVGAPAVAAPVCGAALSVDTGPVDPYQVELFAGARLAIRSVGPILLAVVGVLRCWRRAPRWTAAGRWRPARSRRPPEWCWSWPR